MIPQAGCKFDISENGKYLAVGNSNGSVLVFDLNSYKLEEIYQEHTAGVVAVQWDPNSSNRLATIDTLGNLFIWE